MAPFNPIESIPGYAAAVEREQELRDLAMLDLPRPLCGVPVKQFAPKHLILLGRMGNAFVTGAREPDINDVLQFVWFVSVEYSLDHAKRDAFLAQFLRDSAKCRPIEEIGQYLRDAFYDAPMGADGSPRKSYTSHAAGLVDILAHEYGWPDSVIMEMPMARIFQYIRQITLRKKPDALMFNRSEKVVSDWQRERATAGTS